ncbi:hypothetical protein B0H14DRAFT_3492047 [Mycena olivaceomarginata]|nr:hypothetical protein B0H14DRAFT_3492047 [Mycena olivaceomarginata]
MSSTTSDILGPSNAANQPSTAQLVAQVEALTRIVESSVVQSKTATVTNRKKRRRVDASNTAPDENDPESAQKATLRSYGRNLVRSVGPFERILTIVEHGVTKALADSDDEEHEETEAEKRLTESWNTLKDTIPGFSEDMIGLAGKRQLRKHLQGGLRGARGDDTNSLKAAIGDYAKPLPVLSDSGEPLPVPVLKFSASGTKADRGFNNPHTARLNTPVKHPATEDDESSRTRMSLLAPE